MRKKNVFIQDMSMSMAGVSHVQSIELLVNKQSCIGVSVGVYEKRVRARSLPARTEACHTQPPATK